MCEICSKLTIKHQNDIVLVSLYLTLNRFHTLFWCFHCWLWANNYQQHMLSIWSPYVCYMLWFQNKWFWIFFLNSLYTSQVTFHNVPERDVLLVFFSVEVLHSKSETSFSNYLVKYWCVVIQKSFSRHIKEKVFSSSEIEKVFSSSKIPLELVFKCTCGDRIDSTYKANVILKLELFKT